MRPATIIYDPQLTASLPVAVSVTSLFNAMAHSVEALYAPSTDPAVQLIAEESLHVAVKAVERIKPDTDAASSAGAGAQGAASAVDTASAVTVPRVSCSVSRC